MDLNDPTGFLENLYAFHAQYLKERGTEPFAEGVLKAVLMDFFIAGRVRTSNHFRHLFTQNTSMVHTIMTGKHNCLRYGFGTTICQCFYFLYISRNTRKTVIFLISINNVTY